MFNLIPWRRREEKPRLFYSPFKEMEDMVNRMFGDFFEETALERVGVPAINMYRDADNLVVEASLPSFDKKNITVELNDDMLTISGKQKEESEKKEKDYYHREFRCGSFSRTIKLPEKVKPEDLKAKYQDGILKITMPSSEEERKARTIKIE